MELEAQERCAHREDWRRCDSQYVFDMGCTKHLSSSVKDLFENVNNHSVINFIEQIHFTGNIIAVKLRNVWWRHCAPKTHERGSFVVNKELQT